MDDEQIMKFNKLVGWLGLFVFFLLAVTTNFITHQEYTSGELMVFMLGTVFMMGQIITGGNYV